MFTREELELIAEALATDPRTEVVELRAKLEKLIQESRPQSFDNPPPSGGGNLE